MPTTERLRAALADRYAIDRQIGAGGMATVYLARDLKHDREIALKVLRADLSAVIGAERFLAEVRITARLDHPHILTLIDSGEADGLLYYVLPYVRGESLRARLQHEKQLGIEDALTITRQIGSALDYAHRHGVVHRDIKPENILFHEGEAVLADFGIALAVKEAGGNRLTETGLSLGTPQYMSPEQATGDRTLDARSDIYSLAAVLYEMLAGEPPVTGATAQAVIAKLLTEKPTSIRVVRDTVSPGLDAAIAKALAKVPADRYATAGDFTRALETAVASPSPASGDRRARRRRRVAAAFVVAISAATAWSSRSHFRTSGSAVTIGDRTQITSTGAVRVPTISGDGTQIAYVVANCRPSGCTRGIDLQDVGGSATRKLYDGATALYDIKWSPDRRNLLFQGSVDGVFGMYLVSALGGTPRRVSPFAAVFWAGGDSLLSIRTTTPNPDFWVYVSGLDGVARDSIRIAGPGQEIRALNAIPNSSWIIVRVDHGAGSVWRVIDRGGQERSRLETRAGAAMRVSSDAVWLSFASAHAPVVRYSIEARTGRLAARGDTVYRLATPNSSFTVTSDGSALVVDEGTTEYDAWVLDYRDAQRGEFQKEHLLLHSTSVLGARISPDGNRVLIIRDDGGSLGRRFSVMPVGGSESPLPLVGKLTGNAFWADSVTLAVSEKASSGATQLVLLDVRTNARRASFVVPDSAERDYVPLIGGGWAWLTPDDLRVIAFAPSGKASARRFSIPAWYSATHDLMPSRDGSRLSFVGWSAPTQDSLGLGVMSFPDGKVTHWTAVYGESATSLWMDDGSVLFIVQKAYETYALYRLSAPGKSELLATLPHPLVSITASTDLKRVAAVGRDYHGDAWMLRVVKR